MAIPEISIIVPTLNEAENLPPLVARISDAMKGRTYEVLIVDDNSRDDTKQVCADLARNHPLTLIVREAPRDGLSGAVLYGMATARGQFLVVMDADLQHPPEQLPAVLEPLERNEADFVIGSRYAPGGSTEGRWGLFRRINSRLATLLARPFAGRVCDPMSGFFALRRQTFQAAQRLTPLGYKIGLELMCKCRVQRPREVPIHFAARQKGRSKLTLAERFRYLEHLSRLYDFAFPRLSPVVKFVIVLICSWFFALGIYGLCLMNQVGPIPSIALAYAGAIGVTAIFHLRYVRTQREFIIRPKPWADFAIISAAEWATCVLTAWWLLKRVWNISPMEIMVISLVCATVVRYVLRKEFFQDIRGLRKELRKEEVA